MPVKITKLSLNDVLVLKKPHPCGGNVFSVLRVGSEVRVVCQTCGRDMTIDRIKLEKAIREIRPCRTQNGSDPSSQPSHNN